MKLRFCMHGDTSKKLGSPAPGAPGSSKMTFYDRFTDPKKSENCLRFAHPPRPANRLFMLLAVVVGCWLLVVGCWFLVVGCWLLVVGCLFVVLVVGCCWLLLVVVGCCWLLVVAVVVRCCIAPTWRQKWNPKPPKSKPSWAQRRQNGAKMEPKTSKIEAKLGPEAPKWSQNGAKMRPRRPQNRKIT